MVLVDAYERQIYIPAHVASRQFFDAVHSVLQPGGVVSVNSGGKTFDDPVVRALASTMAHVFGESIAFRVTLPIEELDGFRRALGDATSGGAGIEEE